MSTDEVRTPERDLLFAVIVRSIEDLTSKDEAIKFDAQEFWFQPKGPWADQRRMFLDAVGFDEDAMVENVQHLFDPPERPARTITKQDFYDAMPDHPVAARPIGRSLGLTYSQGASRLQHLLDDGLVVKVERGKFIRADKRDAWQAAKRQVPTVIGTLEDGPKTVREIMFALEGGLGMEAIKNHLRKAANEGLAEYRNPYWTLKTHQDAA